MEVFKCSMHYQLFLYLIDLQTISHHHITSMGDNIVHCCNVISAVTYAHHVQNIVLS